MLNVFVIVNTSVGKITLLKSNIDLNVFISYLGTQKGNVYKI